MEIFEYPKHYRVAVRMLDEPDDPFIQDEEENYQSKLGSDLTIF